jgi:hypothetical protein
VAVQADTQRPRPLWHLALLEEYAAALSRAEHYRRKGKVLFVFGD